MIELELTRSPDDHRLYVLGRAGTLRLGGPFSRNATAESGGESWHFARTDSASSAASTAAMSGSYSS